MTWCFALIWLLGAALPSRAQPENQRDVELAPGITWGGVGFYAPGEWGLVRTTILNRRASDVDALLAITTRGSGNVQFVKEVWLPPRSRLLAVTPMRLERVAEGTPGTDADAALYSAGADSPERPLDSDAGVLMTRAAGVQTAIIGGSNSESLVSMSAALREISGLPPTTSYLSAPGAPTLAAVWKPVHLLVLGDPSPGFSYLQQEAIRRYVIAGGKVWVDLTRVDPQAMAHIFGEQWNLTVLDRVQVAEFSLVWGREADEAQQVVRDYPLDHVRVSAPDMEVLQTVNGYPAALRKSVGRGWVVITTLEPEGWMDAQEKATPALHELRWLMQPYEEPGRQVKRDVLRAVSSEQIGYSVIDRQPVALVLGCFTLLVLGAGLWLARRGGLAKLGWIAPLIAVTATATLLGMGAARKGKIPFTMSAAEVIEAQPQLPYAATASLVSIYTPTRDSATGASLRGEGDPAWPDLRTHSGAFVRVVWTGDQSWRYVNLELREGSVQTAERQTITPLAAPLSAAAVMGADGLHGRVETGGLGAVEDAVILTPTGKLNVRVQRDGSFTSPPLDSLGPEDYFDAPALNQRQEARQAVYRKLAAEARFPAWPVLVGWIGNTTTEVQVSQQALPKDQALLVLPLHIKPAARGEKLAVPAAFMDMRRYRGDRQFVSAAIYDDQKRQWMESNTAQMALMAFTPPPEARLAQVESARLTMDLDAPGRTCEVMVYRPGPPGQGGTLRTVRRLQSPLGKVEVELRGEDAPELLPDGAMVIALDVKEGAETGTTSPWFLKRMQLDVTGVAGGATGQE